MNWETNLVDGEYLTGGKRDITADWEAGMTDLRVDSFV